VLTFDDITEQLLDQRRAAWSDVARRIAHEIKNPLTPIQLAAERLQRRYGGEVSSDPSTFERLTGTIVRQVGDLRRMVDEFSSFARMPKPSFAEESVGEIARQALFLARGRPSGHRLHARHARAAAAPGLRSAAARPGADQRRQERHRGDPAEARGEEGPRRRRPGRHRDPGGRRQDRIEIADTGIGLPPERTRITEPYMTTRAKGTGLGLAIVKKIVEEHFGQIEFEDRTGGGSLVRLVFDPHTLSQLAGGGSVARQAEESIGTG
jgi:two-component system nitrogen regulation sensor histidine kinase NtrY